MIVIQQLHREEQMEAHRKLFWKEYSEEFLPCFKDCHWSDAKIKELLPNIWKRWLEANPIK